jgi:Tfp pilus assembly protein PilN
MKITTLNIRASSISYTVFQDNHVLTWGTVPVSGILKNGLFLEPASSAHQLKSLFASARLPMEKVNYILNGLPFSYRFFTLPDMEASSVSEAIIRLAKKEMPLAPDDMYLSWRSYPPAKDGANYLAIGVSRRPVDTLINVSTEAGIRPGSLCLPHMALASLAERDDGIIVDFGSDCSNLVLAVSGMPAGMHTVPSQGTDVSLQDSAARLAREITRMTGFYNDNHPDKPFPGIPSLLLTGELADKQEFSDVLHENTGYPVKVLAQLPSGPLNAPPEFPLSSYAVNIGASLQNNIPRRSGVAPAPTGEINIAGILDERNRDTHPLFSIKKLAAGTIIAIGVIALGLGYFSQAQEQDKITGLQGQLQQVRMELTQKQDSVKTAAQTEDAINKMAAASLQLNVENRNIFNPRDSVADLKFLTQSLPSSTTFDSIEVNVKQITIRGNTTVEEHVVDYVRTLESSTLFSSVSIGWLDRAATTGSNVITFLITINR